MSERDSAGAASERDGAATGPGARPPLRIGVDLDNTIVCYDGLFHRLALEGGLIPAGLPRSKSAVRAHLCAADREDVWTEMQGEAYGPRMVDAHAFDGAEAFFAECARRAVPVSIVSHRTRSPYRGPAHDLHAAARGWLDRSGILALAGGEVFLETDRDAKVRRIAELGCTHFVDDLADFLDELAAVEGLERIHFDPSGAHDHGSGAASMRCVDSWRQIAGLLLAGPDASGQGQPQDRAREKSREKGG